MTSIILEIDRIFLEFFHSVQSKNNDIFFSYITWFGSLWTLIPLSLIVTFLLLKHNAQNLIFPFYFVLAGCIATIYMLKYTFNRQRPQIYETIGDLPLDPSFPSAHTAQIFIFIFLVTMLFFQIQFAFRYWFLVVACLVAIVVASSRMYLQVHYFSDVFVGFIVACIWGYIGYVLISK